MNRICYVPALLLLVLACDSAAEPDPPRPAAVSVTPATAELTAVGATVRLAAGVRDQDGQPMPSAVVKWTSGTPAVAKVDGSGLVTAVADGTATITATAGAVSTTAMVTVAQVVSTVTVTPAADTVVEADTLRLAAVAADSNGHAVAGVGISWASADTLIAVVDASGLVTGVTVGSVMIGATASGVTGEAEIEVVPPVPSAVSVTPDSVIFAALGEKVAVVVVVFDQVGRLMEGAAVSWASGDTAVAVVDSGGVITAVGNGQTAVTVNSGEAVGSLAIRVEQVARSVMVSPPADTVEIGDTLRLAAAALDANGHRVPRLAVFAWLSSDTAVARVNGLGLVTGKREGTVSITASAEGLQARAEITVENRDRAALVALYEATGGPNWWTHRGNWLTDAPLGEWWGVTTNEDGRVTWLILCCNAQRTGELPAELGNLSALERLWLAGNALTGPIPPELGNLTALYELGLHNNTLTGEIPSELGNLTALERLSLDDNDLSGPIPPELGNLSALRSLGLSHNEALTGPIPSQLLKLTALRGFETRSTGLCLPGTGAFLRWREQVGFRGDAWCNESDRSVLEVLYDAIGGANWKRSEGWLQDGPVLSEWHGVTTDSLGRVAGLALPANNLVGRITSSLGTLTGLKILDVEDNPRLQGPLPLSLTRLALDTLRFAGTGLCSFPEARKWLEAIHVAQGTGATCEPLSDRDALVAFYEATGGPNWARRDNWLTDAPLGEWYRVRVNEGGRVTGLSLGQNGLTGEIPAVLGNLTALESLWLDGNALTGEIPPELGNLTALEWLGLYNNPLLTGEIPPELGNLAALKRLWLRDNALKGEIPAELGNLTALEELTLHANALTGEIPAKLGNLPALAYLDLSANTLTGPIPVELANLSTLESLTLSANALTGEIPPELGNLAALYWLDLGSNALNGPIPPELGNLTLLETLLLGGNEGLSGALPTTLTALGSLNRLFTSYTDLCVPADPIFERWLSKIWLHRVSQCSTTAAYLVQTVQSRDYPVPLVAGRNALLRVFPTAPSGRRVGVPPVRATFYTGATEVYTVDIPGKPGPLPAEIDEGDLEISANVKIPGDVLRQGLEMVVEIDPEGTLDPSLGISRRIPVEGRTALDIHALPTMQLTIVPFLWTEDPDSSILATVEGMAADPEGHELLRLPRAVLPASDWTVTAHEPVWTDIRPTFNNRNALLSRTSAIRAMEGGRGYWMGTLGDSCCVGVAYLPGWTSLSVLNGGTIAHELGHNMSLGHAPCGFPRSLDPYFPHPGGTIGIWGYDFTEPLKSLFDPERPDIMSYCTSGTRPWISDYHFTNALRHRVRAETSSNSVRALLLWGGESESGGLHLDPAFVVDALPVLPDSTGGYTLEGRDAAGRVLFSLPFAMPEIADGDEAAGGFVYTLPVRPGWEALASVKLTAPDGRTAILDTSTDRPMTILRESRTGRVRAFLDGVSAAVLADGGGEDLAAKLGAVAFTSRGIPAPEAWRAVNGGEAGPSVRP